MYALNTARDNNANIYLWNKGLEENVDLLKSRFSDYTQERQWKSMEDQFLSKHWQLVTNKVDHIVFKKENNNYDYFEIKIDNISSTTRINVSIPLRNSQYQYGTHFNNYFEATDFIEQHLQNYED